MKRGMTIEYLKCRADLKFEVDFRENRFIGMIASERDRILFGKWISFIHNILVFSNPTIPLI